MNEAKNLLSKLLIAFQNKTVWQDHEYCSELVEECRRFLRKPEPEPIAWVYDWNETVDMFTKSEIKDTLNGAIKNITPLYIGPPARKPLCDDEINELVCDLHDKDIWAFARAVEKAHGIL